MHSELHSHAPHNYAEPSLIRGGPFYRAQEATRFIRAERWNMGCRIAVAIAITWLPLVLITILTNIAGLPSLLRDYRVYSRLFLALPALLLGQALMESRFRMVVRHLSEANLLDAANHERMCHTIGWLVRLRDSFVPELAILVLLIAHSAAAEKHLVDATPWLAARQNDGFLMTPAGWYAVLVSASVFQFLLGLSLWKWLLWTFFAFNLSRLDMKLVPTHPDENGGLGFLGMTPIAFAPVVFAANCVIGATWREEILSAKANLMTFKLPAIILVIIIALVSLGPLVFFVPRLGSLRRRGILEYGILGQLHSQDFHEKWIHSRTGHEDEFLTAPESSTLADFGQAYEKVKHLNPFPADKEALIALLVAAAIPMVPPVLAAIPLKEVLKLLFEAIR